MKYFGDTFGSVGNRDWPSEIALTRKSLSDRNKLRPTEDAWSMVSKLQHARHDYAPPPPAVHLILVVIVAIKVSGINSKSLQWIYYMRFTVTVQLTVARLTYEREF